MFKFILSTDFCLVNSYLHCLTVGKIAIEARCRIVLKVSNRVRSVVGPRQFDNDLVFHGYNVLNNCTDFLVRRTTLKTVAATEFKAKCLRIIGQMKYDREPVTITKHGEPIAVLSPLPQPKKTTSIIGAMRGSVLAYSDPFSSATDPSDWIASR